MRIAISYPPIINSHGQKAMISQNRNVQYFKTPTYLLPVVQAQAATWLAEKGHDVYWDDGNAQLKTLREWQNDLISFNPDVVLFESTTPVMHFYWELTRTLKTVIPEVIIIFSGYHSLRKPEETLDNSAADAVVLSSHIDFVMVRLCGYISEHQLDWRETCDTEGLLIRLPDNTCRFTAKARLTEDLSLSPVINRDLVRWRDYARENGNFLQIPGTYATSVIRDCTYGKCTFCRYNGPGTAVSVMPVSKSLDEYEFLINQLRVREIFDDSGVWYHGSTARQFAEGIISRGLHKRKCYFGCNTRFEYMDEETIRILAAANWRFILIGLEAADEETLTRLNKGYTLERLECCLEWFKKYGIHTHLTTMVGYYWQTEAQVKELVRTVRRYLFKGLIRTMQATICTPLDFTPYHNECIEQGVLCTDNYDHHDMSRIIVKTPAPHTVYYRAIATLYRSAFHPRFVLRQLLFLFSCRKRDWQFVFLYGLRAVRRVRNHLFNLTRGVT